MLSTMKAIIITVTVIGKLDKSIVQVQGNSILSVSVTDCFLSVKKNKNGWLLRSQNFTIEEKLPLYHVPFTHTNRPTPIDMYNPYRQIGSTETEERPVETVKF